MHACRFAEHGQVCKPACTRQLLAQAGIKQFRCLICTAYLDAPRAEAREAGARWEVPMLPETQACDRAERCCQETGPTAILAAGTAIALMLRDAGVLRRCVGVRSGNMPPAHGMDARTAISTRNSGWTNVCGAMRKVPQRL